MDTQSFLAGAFFASLICGVVHLFYRHLMGNILKIAAEENWSARDLKAFIENPDSDLPK